MSTLHLVFDTEAARLCAARRSPGDVTVLVGDGVYAQLDDAHKLADDLALRGLTSNFSISMQKLVELTVTHDSTISWHTS